MGQIASKNYSKAATWEFSLEGGAANIGNGVNLGLSLQGGENMIGLYYNVMQTITSPNPLATVSLIIPTYASIALGALPALNGPGMNFLNNGFIVYPLAFIIFPVALLGPFEFFLQSSDPLTGGSIVFLMDILVCTKP